MNSQHFPKINFRKLSHEQLRTLSRRVVDNWVTRKDIPHTIKLILIDIEDTIYTMGKVLLRRKDSKHTQLIHVADENRDRAYRLLVRKVQDAAHEFDETKVNAAGDVLDVLETYGTSLHRLPYAEQSARAKMLFSELKKHLGYIDTLNVRDEFERAEGMNEEFEAILNKKVLEESAQEELPTLRSVETELIDLMRLLLLNTEYLYRREEVEESFFLRLRFEIIEASSLIKMRATLSAKEQLLA